MPQCDVCHTPLETRGTRFYCPACMLKDFWNDDDLSEAETKTGDQLTEPASPFSKDPTAPEVPRHRLLEKLGEGGFAVVFRAMQLQPVRREVAVKVLKANLAHEQVLARFDAERQTLARMEHPGIARLWDAGQTTAGQPFFAMELVRGEPVTTFCNRCAVDLRGRLAIFISICQAVQHAHEKGVLHRDLKPSNLLVDDNRQPKVIDFGIAKALESMPDDGPSITTSVHQTVGTPGYMSPEQAVWGANLVDSRADIYALGVVLYELVSGKTPLDVERRSRSVAYRALVAERITPPSRLQGCLLSTKTEVRDLEAVILKALEHESQMRYASAAALADDVERHLNDQPVEARHHTWTYVIGKFARRHRGLVVSTVTALLAVLIGFTTSTALFFREQEARKVAVSERKKAESERIAAEEARREVEAREKDLSRALSRSDYAAAQHYKADADQQSAVACLVRSLQNDPTFTQAAADLQTLLAWSDFLQPIEAPLPLGKGLGRLTMGTVGSGGRVIAATFQSPSKQERLMLWQTSGSGWLENWFAVDHSASSVSLSASGLLLAVVDKEGLRVRLINTADSTVARVWLAPTPVQQLVIDNMGTGVAAGLQDGSVWRLTADATVAAEMAVQTTGQITRLVAGSGLAWLFIGNKQGEVRKWTKSDPATTKLMLKLPSAVTMITQSASDKQFAAGDAVGWVGLVERNGTAHAPVKLHDGRITALGLASDGQVISAGSELKVRWFDMATNTDTAPPLDSAGLMEEILYERAGDEALLVTADASVRLWRRSVGVPVTLRAPQRSRFVALNNAGRCLIVQRDEGTALEVLSLGNQHAVGLSLHPGGNRMFAANGVSAMAGGPNPGDLFVADQRGGVWRWDMTSAENTGLLSLQSKPLAMTMGSNGRLEIAFANGRWMEQPTSLGENATDVFQAETETWMSPVGSMPRWNLAAISADSHLVAWSEISGKALTKSTVRVAFRDTGKTRDFNSTRVTTLAISNAAKMLAIGMNNGVVNLIDLNTDTLRTFSRHLSRLTTVAFSPDGRALVTASTDGNIGVWDPRNGGPLADYLRVDEPVDTIAFSGDGKRFAYATASHVGVVDMQTFGTVGPKFRLPHFGGSVCMNSDGTRVAAALPGGAAMVFQLAPEMDAPPPWFNDLACAHVSRKFNKRNALSSADHPGLVALTKMIPPDASGPWRLFGAWLIERPGLRTVTPWSTLTLQGYLDEINSRPGAAARLESHRLGPLSRVNP